VIEDLKYPLLRLWIEVQDHGVFSIGAILGLIVFYTARYIASPYRKLPQGPRGYPIIGTLVEMRARQCFMFSECTPVGQGAYFPAPSAASYVFLRPILLSLVYSVVACTYHHLTPNTLHI